MESTEHSQNEALPSASRFSAYVKITASHLRGTTITDTAFNGHVMGPNLSPLSTSGVTHDFHKCIEG